MNHDMALQTQESAMLARQFLEMRGPNIHSTLALKSHFNASASEYELAEIHELRETLEVVERQAPHLLGPGLDVKDCTWEQVLIQLQRAQDAANESEMRGKKFHHKVWRRLGSAADFAIPALDAFPDDLCILHGGLAVIFSIAQQRNQDRTKLLRSVGNIPQIMYTAMSKAEHFPPDETKPETIRLHESISYLRGTLLKVLPALIERLVPGTLLRKALSPFKGFDIDNLLHAISSAADKVKVCADHLIDGVLVDTNKVTLENRNIAMGILEATESNALETSRGILELQEKVNEVLKLRETLELGIDALKLERKLDATAAKNGYLQFFQEFSKSLLVTQQRPYHALENPPYEPPGFKLSQLLDGLLNRLDHAHFGAVHDEYCVIRRGLSFDDAAMSQAATIMTTYEAQRLLQSPQSGMLLVDGCGDRAQISGTISPMSLACTYLARILRSRPQSAALVFFCGQHLGMNDALRGPQGMLRSLMAQLILILAQSGWISDEAPAGFTPGWFWEACNRLDLRDLCQLFRWLLGLVPEWTDIFCLVDGVSHYEAEQWRSDYYSVLECFDAILKDRYLAGYFKLLMTSPTTNRQLPPQVSHERVSLRNVGVGAATGFERSLRGMMNTG